MDMCVSIYIYKYFLITFTSMQKKITVKYKVIELFQ